MVPASKRATGAWGNSLVSKRAFPHFLQVDDVVLRGSEATPRQHEPEQLQPSRPVTADGQTKSPKKTVEAASAQAATLDLHNALQRGERRLAEVRREAENLGAANARLRRRLRDLAPGVPQ